MKLVTFQPLEVLKTLEKDGVYVPKDNDRLGKRVYCLAVNEYTAEALFRVAPSMPQVAIYSDTDTCIEELDSIAWVNSLHMGIEYKKSNAHNYKEYTIRQIDKAEVYKTEVITTEADPDMVQDMWMNYHFKYLEELSGHKWSRSGDSRTQEFWSSQRAYVFVETLAQCMLPTKRPAEIKDFDKASRLTKKYFMEG